MGFTGTPKGVNFFNTVHVKMRVFMVVYLSYVRKGIPFRRGYLLHGVPRRYSHIGKESPCADGLVTFTSGKTSFILSLAGELGLDIYVLILSSKGCVYSSSPNYPINSGG